MERQHSTLKALQLQYCTALNLMGSATDGIEAAREAVASGVTKQSATAGELEELGGALRKLESQWEGVATALVAQAAVAAERVAVAEERERQAVAAAAEAAMIKLKRPVTEVGVQATLIPQEVFANAMTQTLPENVSDSVMQPAVAIGAVGQQSKEGATAGSVDTATEVSARFDDKFQRETDTSPRDAGYTSDSSQVACVDTNLASARQAAAEALRAVAAAQAAALAVAAIAEAQRGLATATATSATATAAGVAEETNAMVDAGDGPLNFHHNGSEWQEQGVHAKQGINTLGPLLSKGAASTTAEVGAGVGDGKDGVGRSVWPVGGLMGAEGGITEGLMDHLGGLQVLLKEGEDTGVCILHR
jgi:hypothetical protein